MRLFLKYIRTSVYKFTGKAGDQIKVGCAMNSEVIGNSLTNYLNGFTEATKGVSAKFADATDALREEVEKLNMMGIRHYEIMDIEQKKPKVILFFRYLYIYKDLIRLKSPESYNL
mgnify:CR=1 FL=1